MTRKHEGPYIVNSTVYRYASVSALQYCDPRSPIHDHNERLEMQGDEEGSISPRREVRRENRSGPIDSLYSRIGAGQRWKRHGPIMGPYRVRHNDQCRRVEILSGSSRNTGRVVERTPLNEIPTCSSRAWGIMASVGCRRRSTRPITSALTLSRFKCCHSTRTGSRLTSPLAVHRFGGSFRLTQCALSP